MRMKPLKGRASSTEELKKGSKKLKKSKSFTPAITSFFKASDSKFTKSLATKLQTPVNNTPSNILHSPVSRSPSKKRNNLTPMKLSNSFTFDFPKLPSVAKRDSSPVCCKLDMCPPTPSQAPHCTPSQPSPPSHQSFPSSTLNSPVAPPYFPVDTPSPQTQANLEYYMTMETPLPPRLPLKTPPRRYSLKLNKKNSPIRYEVIMISSDSDEPDAKGVGRPGKSWMKENGRVNIKNEPGVTIKSEPDLVPPKPKKTCTENLKSYRTPNSPGSVEIVRVSPSKWSSHQFSMRVTQTSASVTLDHGSVEIVYVSPSKWPSHPGTVKLTGVHSQSIASGTVGRGSVKAPLKQSTYPSKEELSQPSAGTKCSPAKVQLDLKDPLPSLASCFASTVKLGTAGPSQCERLTEVQKILWLRGTPNLTTVAPSSQKVKLLNAAQSAILESHLDSGSRFLSDKLNALVQYLSLVTSPTTIPQGKSLATLFLLIGDPQVMTCNIHSDVMHSSVSYFSQLLLLHPPGSHRVVDQQYREFMTTLEQKGDFCTLWEMLQMLMSLSGHNLLSFFVDLLLSDYWSTIHQGSSVAPLFRQVFWSSREHTNVTTPIRQLIDEISKLIQSSSTSVREKALKLDSLMALLYLCSTVCTDLKHDLLAMCKSLPSSGLRLILPRLHASSLYSHIVKGVSGVQESLVRAEEAFSKSLDWNKIDHRLSKMDTEGTTSVDCEQSLYLLFQSLLSGQAEMEAKDAVKPDIDQPLGMVVGGVSETSSVDVEPSADDRMDISGSTVEEMETQPMVEAPQSANLDTSEMEYSNDPTPSTGTHAVVNSRSTSESNQTVSCGEVMDKPSSTGVTEMAWETISYGEDKFPCVRRSPVKPKTPSPAKAVSTVSPRNKEAAKVHSTLSGILPRKALGATKTTVPKASAKVEVSKAGPKVAAKKALFSTQPAPRKATTPAVVKDNSVKKLINNTAYIKAQQKSATAPTQVKSQQKPMTVSTQVKSQQKPMTVSTQVKSQSALKSSTGTCQTSTINMHKPPSSKGHPVGLAHSMKTCTIPVVKPNSKPSVPKGLTGSKKQSHPHSSSSNTLPKSASNTRSTLNTTMPSITSLLSRPLAKTTRPMARVNTTTQKPHTKTMVKTFSRAAPSTKPPAKPSTSLTKGPGLKQEKSCENCKTGSCVRCDHPSKTG